MTLNEVRGTSPDDLKLVLPQTLASSDAPQPRLDDESDDDDDDDDDDVDDDDDDENSSIASVNGDEADSGSADEIDEKDMALELAAKAEASAAVNRGLDADEPPFGMLEQLIASSPALSEIHTLFGHGVKHKELGAPIIEVQLYAIQSAQWATSFTLVDVCPPPTTALP
jgi:hypothetical protein